MFTTLPSGLSSSVTILTDFALRYLKRSQQLSDEYYVSRSSIAKDIAYLKTLFVKENLLLRFDNSGTYFQGSESQIQRMLKRFILLTMEQSKRTKSENHPKKTIIGW